MLLTPDNLADLTDLIEKHGKAANLADSLNINRGLISRALNDGYVAPALAKAMGWPTTAPAPVCTNPDCDNLGHPDTYDCRTQVVRPKPAKTRKRATRPTIKAYVTISERDAIRDAANRVGMNLSEFIKDRCLK